MRITVRRKDSVSSILLYLFNVFLVEKGVTSIPLKKIFKILEPFEKNETSIRMGLSRELKGETLINAREGGEVVYRLTETALEGFKHWMRVMDHDRAKMAMQAEPWDGRWRLLVVRDAEGAAAADLRDALDRLGFGRLNRDTWITPYDRRRELEASQGSSSSPPRLSWFECILPDDEERSAMIDELWPVEELGLRYRAFLKELEAGTAAAADASSPEDGRELPLLYRLGLGYFQVSQDDPRLPLALLPPDWPGTIAADAFGKLRSELLPRCRSFVERALEEGPR